MDCAAEERLVRFKLEPLPGVERLVFDLPSRKLEVFHAGEPGEIRAGLEELGLGAVQTAHEDNAQPDPGDAEETGEKGPLLAAFSINASLFAAELAAGLMAYSLGLIADSLDMLADAMVYGMALAAVGGTALKKRGIARMTGYFQGFLALAGLAEVLRRFLAGEGIPDFRVMILLSVLALIGNGATLLILNRTRKAGVHMQAAWICTSVDVRVNALVIASGVAVFLSGSRYPDLAAGGLIFLLVADGARRILALTK